MPTPSSGKNAQGYTKTDVETPTVELVTHLGARVTVPRRRADNLLKRGLIDIPGGKRAQYRLASEVDAEEKAKKTGSAANG